MLVFDEVHRVKRIEGAQASQALKVAKAANFIITMTGTPIPNSYSDLYNLLNILFSDEYKEFFGFDIYELANPDESMIQRINQKIQPFFCRTSKEDLMVPPPNDDSVEDVVATHDEQSLFDILLKKYRDNRLALIIRLLQLETNPKLLLKSIDINEFRDILDIPDEIDNIGFIDLADEVKSYVDKIDITSKKQKCLELVSNLVNQGKSAIVWCIFIDSILDINSRLSAQGISAECIYGDVKQEERDAILSRFRNGDTTVLITNPHTLAESVSLHQVCHDAIYYEYSYNLVHLLQSKDRIHRLGLPEGQYTQYYYLQNIFWHDGSEFSLDEKIYLRLKEKETIMLDAIDNNELETVYSTEEDLAFIFKDL